MPSLTEKWHGLPLYVWYGGAGVLAGAGFYYWRKRGKAGLAAATAPVASANNDPNGTPFYSGGGGADPGITPTLPDKGSVVPGSNGIPFPAPADSPSAVDPIAELTQRGLITPNISSNPLASVIPLSGPTLTQQAAAQYSSDLAPLYSGGSVGSRLGSETVTAVGPNGGAVFDKPPTFAEQMAAFAAGRTTVDPRLYPNTYK